MPLVKITGVPLAGWVALARLTQSWLNQHGFSGFWLGGLWSALVAIVAGEGVGELL